MRLNKFVAASTGMSRRAADEAITKGRVIVNGTAASLGQEVTEHDTVTLDGKQLLLPSKIITIMLNKPVGYVCSRDGQGSKTIYDLLPPELQHLKPAGRLDKDSSGLLLLTNDGELAHQLTHPRYEKTKVYEVTLDHELLDHDFQTITSIGVELDDGTSKLGLEQIDHKTYRVTMHEGRNRQIRRTFAVLGYNVVKLHRTHLGDYELSSLKPGKYRTI